MDNLIPIFTSEIANKPSQVVNAYALHQFLEISKDFSAWIKDGIQQYGFIEHQDYVAPLKNKGIDKYDSHGYVDYYLTLDMAKMLSLVEHSDKGKQARSYVIDYEKQLQATISAREIAYLEKHHAITCLDDIQRDKVFWVTVDEWIAAVLIDTHKKGYNKHKAIVHTIEKSIPERSKELTDFRIISLKNDALQERLANFESIVETEFQLQDKYNVLLEKYITLLEKVAL